MRVLMEAVFIGALLAGVFVMLRLAFHDVWDDDE